MRNPIDEFGNAVREKRRSRNLTQQQLAVKLGMNQRTIMQAEKGSGDRKFETIISLAQELEISLDDLIFPEKSVSNTLPKCVYDFFEGKPEREIRKYITLCQFVENLYSES